MSVERGGSFQEDGSTTILLEANDRLRSDHISPLRRAQNMWKTNMHNVTIDSWSQAGSSFEEASGQQSLLDVAPVKNQMKGHLTPPHLSTYQTVSLDIPSSHASMQPNLLPGDSITSSCQLQCTSLDISPTSTTGATKKLKQSKPITPISIHIRRPTVKASVHGRNNEIDTNLIIHNIHIFKLIVIISRGEFSIFQRWIVRDLNSVERSNTKRI